MRFAVLFVCLLPSLALADRVHLDNGRVVEGEVREEGDDYVVRRGNGIEARFPRARVVRVEASETLADRFQARLEALDRSDLDDHLALAAWCEDQGLRQEARVLRERILENWPHDPITRQAMGYIRHEGQWITRADYMRSLGLVESGDGDSWITEAEAARRARSDAAKAQEPEIRKVIRSARRDADEAALQVKAFGDEAAVPVLIDHLESETLEVRRFAMRELGRRKSQAAARELAEVAVEDTQREARADARAALKSIAHPAVGDYLVRQLGRDHAFQRVHAVEAIGDFPVVGAIPALIVTLRQATSGFGRNHISVMTQRAYIRDFQINTGGSGLVVAEVADPQVDTQTEGVTLDVKVVKWERYTVVSVLERLSGQSFGADPDAWERWWRGARDGFELPDGD